MADAVALRFIDLTREELARVLRNVEERLPREDFLVVKALVDSQRELTRLARARGTTIARLRNLFGLSKSERIVTVA